MRNSDIRCTGALAAPEPSGGGKEPANWNDYMQQLRAAGERVMARLPSGDSQLRQETYEMMFAALTRSFITAAVSDPAHPMFTPELNLALNLLAPNADTVYVSAAVDDKGVYRIRGNRGGVLILNTTQVAGIGPIKGGLDLDTLRLDQNGNFEVIVSPERPQGHAGDWWKLQPGTRALMVRQVSYDWGKERDPALTIVRLDTPPARPRPTAEELSGKFSDLATQMEKAVLAFIDHVPKLEREGVVNRLKFINYSQAVGLTGQHYYEGVFDIADDEALILEVKPPKTCRYWSVILTDEIFATLDWVNRQSSLNGAQSRIDKDGVFRAVISKKDPGVPNWLDTADHGKGAIQGRFTHCGSSEPPLPAVRKVSLAKVRDYLPANTPVVSAQERHRQLRLRREGAQRRQLW